MAKDNNNNQPIDKTELVWPGKRKEVERVELPFQTIETINLPRGARQNELFGKSGEEGWKNQLIWGDNLLVMGSLLKEFAGKINLIYIDPPFATGDNFSFEVQIGDGIEITKEPSALEVKAYRDTWGKGMQSYLQMMYDRLVLMKELLADNGSIYVHLDATVGHYVKAIMDEIFGRENFQREIIWRIGWISGYKSAAKNWIRNHDTILFYVKNNNNFVFNKEYISYPPTYRRRDGSTPDGAGYPIDDVWNASDIDKMDSIQIMSFSQEKTGYDTQKNLNLLQRIIKASSNEGDLVADFFCGSGTTGVAAEKLGRRWIMSDLGRFAIHTARKRLLDMGAKPFVVQNLGKYERHRWAKLNGKYKNYTKFILELYHAEPVDGFTHLHGKKAKSFVRVGAVDAPVTLSEIRETLAECKENNIKKLDVLGWEWEMGLHDLVKEEAEKYGVKLSTLQIPREVMEISPTEAKKHDIQFFELAYLEVEPKVEGRRVTIALKDFIIPNPELLPEEVKGKVKSWNDFIDYWAVDWMFNQHEEETEEDDTFHNMNQCYRTRKEPKLELSMDYEYKKAGKYNVLVKVIDIFGNDTTKLIEVKVK
jgi:DNA modification methylase